VFWSCGKCGGQAMGIGLLRKIMGNKPITAAWALAMNATDTNGRGCPVCMRHMVGVAMETGSQTLKLDLCKRCEFIWFDAGEYKALQPLPPKRPALLGEMDEKDLPPAARETLALERVQWMARTEQIEPDMDWKTIPGLLGLPVEMDSTTRQKIPWATYSLAVLMAAASIWAFFDLKNRVDHWGLIPAEVWRYRGLTLLTSFFLHAGIFHLVGNLYFLVIFGSHVEDYLGRARWWLLLFLSTGMGDFLHVMADPDSTVPCIGASGGIAGLITFYALKFPHARLGVMFRYFVCFRWIPLPAWSAFVFWMFFQFWGAYAQSKGFSAVSSFAHLGGVAVGVLAWLTWRKIELRAAISPNGARVARLRS